MWQIWYCPISYGWLNSYWVNIKSWWRIYMAINWVTRFVACLVPIHHLHLTLFVNWTTRNEFQCFFYLKKMHLKAPKNICKYWCPSYTSFDLWLLLYDFDKEIHDDVIKWEYSPRYWPFVREIHRSPLNSPHKSQWRRVLMFSLTYAWTNCWINNRDTGGLRRYWAHYDVIVMLWNIVPLQGHGPMTTHWLLTRDGYTKLLPPFVED